MPGCLAAGGFDRQLVAANAVEDGDTDRQLFRHGQGMVNRFVAWQRLRLSIRGRQALGTSARPRRAPAA